VKSNLENFEMTNAAIDKSSPRSKARIAGLWYLVTMLMGVITSLAGGGFTTTLDSIRHPSFWLGYAADLSMVICYVVVTALFYYLFRPVNMRLSLLAAFFSLVGCSVQAFINVFHIAALVLLGGAQDSSAFSSEQLRVQATMSLELYNRGYGIAMVFYGCYCLLIGYFIFKSTFLPRVLGVLLAISGLACLTFIIPPLAHALYPYNLAIDGFGELALTLWLLVIGVNPQRWQEQAGAALEE
jgi:hypothetical protein